MIDVKIDYDEWYPVYTMDIHGWGRSRRVPQEFYDRYENTCKAFHEMQRLLSKMHDEAKKKEQEEKSKSPTAVQSIGF